MMPLTLCTHTRTHTYSLDWLCSATDFCLPSGSVAKTTIPLICPLDAKQNCVVSTWKDLTSCTPWTQLFLLAWVGKLCRIFSHVGLPHGKLASVWAEHKKTSKVNVLSGYGQYGGGSNRIGRSKEKALGFAGLPGGGLCSQQIKLFLKVHQVLKPH